MKHILLFLFSFCVSTSHGQVRGEYTITGDITPLIESWEAAPDSISMIFMQDYEKTDPVELRDGKFQYRGRVDARYVPTAYLRLFGPGPHDEPVSMTIPVFLEPGQIRVWCRELPDEDMYDIIVDGTPSNELMSAQMSRYYDLNYAMLDIARDTTLTEEESYPLIYELYEEQENLFRNMYLDNRDSPIAPMLAIQQFYGTNNFRETGEALAYLEEKFPEHPDLHDLESVWMSMEGVTVGDIIPAFTLSDRDGNRPDWQHLSREGYILIDFWSSLVGPSLEDFDALRQIPPEYQDRPLTILGICTDNVRSTWLESLRKYDPPGVQVWDEGHTVSRAFHITSYPVRFLVDAEGIVIAKGNFTVIPEPETIFQEELVF